MINCASPISKSVLSFIDQVITLRPDHYSVIKQTTVCFIDNWCYCDAAIRKQITGVTCRALRGR